MYIYVLFKNNLVAFLYMQLDYTHIYTTDNEEHTCIYFVDYRCSYFETF